LELKIKHIKKRPNKEIVPTIIIGFDQLIKVFLLVSPFFGKKAIPHQFYRTIDFIDFFHPSCPFLAPICPFLTLAIQNVRNTHLNVRFMHFA
jgi:hypothetical protein